MKKFSKRDLARLVLEHTKNGFVLWIREENGTNHWVIDGSTLLDEGCITIGDEVKEYRFTAEYSEYERELQLVKKPKILKP